MHTTNKNQACKINAKYGEVPGHTSSENSHAARNEPAFRPKQTNILVRRTSERAKAKKKPR